MSASRGFSQLQRIQIFLKSGGSCQLCRCRITIDNFHADHVIPWSKGGQTVVKNGQALCPPCNLKKSATMSFPYQNYLPSGWTIRKWQDEFLQRFGTEAIRQVVLPPDSVKAFVLYAFPGSGKSLAQSLAAKTLLDQGYIDYVVICVPSKTLKYQMQVDAEKVGLHLSVKRITGDPGYPDGVVVTYQQLAYRDQETGRLANAEYLRSVCESKKVFVCADEMHHIGKSRNWGEGFQLAFDEFSRARLMTSGTPFRSDGSTIPWCRYRSKKLDLSPPHAYSYGYGTTQFNEKYSALGDRAVRDVSIVPWDGRVKFEVVKKVDGEIVDQRDYDLAISDNVDALYPDIVDPDTGEKIVDNAAQRNVIKSRRREAVIECGTPRHPYGTEYVENILKAANRQLEECRRAHPWAAGLIVCDGIEHAKKVQAALKFWTQEDAVLVTSESGESRRDIEKFRKDTTRSRAKWIISVAQISEGVDIKHLRVCVYLTVIQAPLRWTQILGRILRTEDSLDWDMQTAYFYQYDDGIEYVDQGEDGEYIAGSANIKLYAETLLQERWITLESKDKPKPKPSSPCPVCHCRPCVQLPACPPKRTTEVHTDEATGENTYQTYNDDRYDNSETERFKVIATRLKVSPVKLAYMVREGGLEEWRKATND